MQGRLYRTSVELRYAGGTLPEDARTALADAIRADLGDEQRAVSFTVSPQPFDVVIVESTVREQTPVGAIAWIDAAVDRVLVRTGLFEEFDVTGKVLHVAPVEQVGRTG
jgi:hypothetical protein